MLRKDLDDLDINGEKGDWCFLNENKLIAIRYGDSAFDGTAILPIAEEIMEGKPHWKWNGSKELPSLTPSILVRSHSNGWHGYLTNGKLETV